MGLLTIVVEDAEDLDRAIMSAESVRGHRRKLCGLPGFDEDRALPQLQARCARQDREPVPPRMDSQLLASTRRYRVHNAILATDTP